MEIVGLNTQIAKSLGAISNKIGLVNIFRRAHLQNSDPRIVAYSASTANAGALTDSFVHLAGGAGVTWKDAFLATIGEAVERYGSSFYDLGRLKKGSARDFDSADIILPAKYALFAKEQYATEGFKFVPFNDDTEIYWDTATDLTDGKMKYLPASFIYMPFSADPRLISEQISTGYAVHSDPNRALLSAICEVVERDAFMISWMNMLDLKKFRIDGELKKFVDSIIPEHFELHLLDMTTDLNVPSVLGILKGSHDFGDFIVVCACSRFDFFSAAKKTIVELCQSVPYFRSLLELDKDYSDFYAVKAFIDHSLFYLHRKEYQPIFDKWLDTKPTLKLTVEVVPEPDVQLKHIVQSFRQLGYPVLVKDKTTVDLEQAGFYLVRAVCPGLIHLNGTYGAYYLGGERLYNVPVRMGLRDHPNTYDTLNHLPHPFP
jgi:ribosomal protein S12 methylthiotransferase accessory factor